MERLTLKKHDIVLLRKDGQLVPPMNMSGQEIRMVMERLAELEDAIEQGELVEVVHCAECKHLMFSDFQGECSRGYLGIVMPNSYCIRGERKDGE